eukprot:Phypoly_transcript_22177.p1 GENE.Phypoly_transcript_22177~~Phypoly_transcript_22177.p1  ORF type:complete len:163 (+),score=22.76 Phypoly_transcript_22177:36-524(+)
MMNHTPTFKPIPPPFLSKHYALFALLLLINIVGWIILVIIFPPSRFFLILLSIMVGFMFLELFPIFSIYNSLSKGLPISNTSNFIEFLCTCLSFVSVAAPCMWASFLLRAHEMCSETCILACDPEETIFLIPFLFAFPLAILFVYPWLSSSSFCFCFLLSSP